MRPQLIAALIIVATLPLIWFVAKPFWNDVQRGRATVHELNQAVAAEKEANQRLDRLAQEIESRQADIEKLEMSVTARPDPAALIAAFEEAAANNGLILDSINILDQTGRTSAVAAGSDTSFQSLGTQIQLTGRYSAFDSFLADVERSFPLLDVAHTTLESADEGAAGVTSSDPDLAFEVTLISYYLR